MWQCSMHTQLGLKDWESGYDLRPAALPLHLHIAHQSRLPYILAQICRIFLVCWNWTQGGRASYLQAHSSSYIGCPRELLSLGQYKHNNAGLYNVQSVEWCLVLFTVTTSDSDWTNQPNQIKPNKTQPTNQPTQPKSTQRTNEPNQTKQQPTNQPTQRNNQTKQLINQQDVAEQFNCAVCWLCPP
jgi:hypothetical protein